MNALSRKTLSTVFSLVALAPVFTGCTANDAPAPEERVTITMTDSTGQATVEDIGYGELDRGIAEFPTWIIDGVATNDPARLVTGTDARLERADVPDLVLRNQDGRIAIVEGNPPSTGIVAVTFDETREHWILTGINGDVLELELDGVREEDRDSVLGAMAGSLLSLEESEAKPSFAVPIIPIVVGIGFLACTFGTCGETCKTACAPGSVQSFSSSCWPFYSSCTCNCFANGDQSPSPNPNPVPTPPATSSPGGSPSE